MSNRFWVVKAVATTSLLNASQCMNARTNPVETTASHARSPDTVNTGRTSPMVRVSSRSGSNTGTRTAIGFIIFCISSRRRCLRERSESSAMSGGIGPLSRSA